MDCKIALQALLSYIFQPEIAVDADLATSLAHIRGCKKCRTKLASFGALINSPVIDRLLERQTLNACDRLRMHLPAYIDHYDRERNADLDFVHSHLGICDDCRLLYEETLEMVKAEAAGEFGEVFKPVQKRRVAATLALSRLRILLLPKPGKMEVEPPSSQAPVNFSLATNRIALARRSGPGEELEQITLDDQEDGMQVILLLQRVESTGKDTVRLTVTVQNTEDGKGIPGAQVTITGKSGIHSEPTDDEGFFRGDLLPGEYMLEILHDRRTLSLPLEVQYAPARTE